MSCMFRRPRVWIGTGSWAKRLLVTDRGGTVLSEYTKLEKCSACGGPVSPEGNCKCSW